MRKNIVIVGLVLLIIGVGLFFGGAQILAPHVKINTTESTEVSLGNNLWRTNTIIVNGTNYIIEDESSSNSVYLVSASSLSSLNQNNLKTLGIAPSSHTSVSSKILYTFTVSSPGNYYIVTNSSSQPTNSVSVLNPDSIVGDAIILLVGGALGFIGFITLIIGLVLKKKVPPNPEQY